MEKQEENQPKKPTGPIVSPYMFAPGHEPPHEPIGGSGDALTLDKDNIGDVLNRAVEDLRGKYLVPEQIPEFIQIVVTVNMLDGTINVSGKGDASLKLQALCEAIVILMPECERLLALPPEKMLEMVIKRIRDNPNRFRTP